MDAESGKNIPYAGAGFKIFDPDGNQVIMTFTYPTPTTIDTFYTDANGQLVTPEKLEYGKGYSLVEVQAPYGYVLDSTPVYFDVAEEHSSDEGGITVIKVDKPNMAQKGTVSIEKTGEVFSGVNISGEENADVIYQPVYEVKGLAGAVYEIAAAEDIITPDGTLRYANGEVVDTVTTDENGLAKSKELYLGRYTVVEITAPEGMVINKEAHEVELTYAGQEVSVTETATSFVNDRQKVTVSLEKTIEKNDIFNIGNGDEVKNISFGLFAAEELVSASGTSIPADGLIEIISLSENGKAVIKTDLPFGSYYVKELAADEHYILSDSKYPFTFSYAGQDTETVEIAVNDGKPIENKLIYGSVSGKKITENGEELGGAVIGLFKAEETEFVKENALMTATSEKDGRPFDETAGILHHSEGVDLLPSNIELSGMEVGLFNVMSREYVLRNFIDTVRKNYDYVLIDCMPSLGMMTINALAAADSVVIPSQPSFLSAKGLDLLLRSISKVKRSINPDLKIDGILLTMVDGRTNNAREIIESLRSTVGRSIRIFDTEIPHSVRAAECSITGESIFAHDRNGKVAEAYEKLTKEVTELEGKTLNRSGHDWVR